MNAKRLLYVFFLLLWGALSEAEENSPFFGWVQYEDMAKADFQGKERRGQHLKYRLAKINVGSILHYNPDCKEGLATIVSYSRERLYWNRNPNFAKDDYNTLSLSLAAFTERLGDWFWRANVTYNQNSDHLADWERYSSWDFFLWGRHFWQENKGLHFGFYGITGMHIDKVYPVIGFDWQYSDAILINAVFPMDMSVIWKYNKCLSLSGSIHFFQSRQRVGEREPISMGLWYFETWGTELGLNYYVSDIVRINLHTGYVLGGKLKMADRNYDNPHHFKFKSAPYLGGELKLSY